MKEHVEKVHKEAEQIKFNHQCSFENICKHSLNEHINSAHGTIQCLSHHMRKCHTKKPKLACGGCYF